MIPPFCASCDCGFGVRDSAEEIVYNHVGHVIKKACDWGLLVPIWYTRSGTRYVYVEGGKCLFIKGSLRGGSPLIFPG